MNMKKGFLPFVIIPVLLLFTAIDTDLALFPYCSNDTHNYTQNSTFENNLKLLLQSLPANTAPTGFNNTSYGEFPDKVYGQALCRGDVNSTVCQSCVENATQEILKDCKSEDALLWYELCQIRYKFQNFFSQSVYTGKYPDWDDEERNVSYPVRFNRVLSFLLSNLSSEAAFGSSKGMFATGEIEYSETEMIYGLVQCTKDISMGECKNCLDSAFGDLKACCYSQEGGMILSRNCNVRFETNSFYNASSYLVIYATPKGEKWKIWMVVLVAGLTTLVLAILICSYIFRKRSKRDNRKESHQAQLKELGSSVGVTMTEQGDLVTSEELPFMDVSIIRAATENFSDSNKLGQGGFGTVYKGLLPDGKEVAVKRLSRTSWQGLDEMKNEIILIAKLQHRNLVKLLGCVDSDEKLLIYDYMPNRSLDSFIFDSERRNKLDWETYYNIIGGIAKGILYLHEDSRLRIIHRDLKPSNVLLDHEMVAKISDFGMARIFGENQVTSNTKRVVGTYGYMAPEYAMSGHFSVKSDVFSFGVLLLEIISGKKNNGFYQTEQARTLLAFAWRLWNEGKQLEFIDPILECPLAEIVKCMQIGLLCVQEDPEDRPTMSYVVVMLESDPTLLPQPKQPAFSVGRMPQIDSSLTIDPSMNHMTPSILTPR